MPSLEDSFHVALSPPECRQPPLSSRRPRTLLCHDMMGGYLDDRWGRREGIACVYCCLLFVVGGLDGESGDG